MDMDEIRVKVKKDLVEEKVIKFRGRIMLDTSSTEEEAKAKLEKIGLVEVCVSFAINGWKLAAAKFKKTIITIRLEVPAEREQHG